MTSLFEIRTVVWNKTVDNEEGDSHCWYCGGLFTLMYTSNPHNAPYDDRGHDFTVDHMDPKGGDNLINLVPACRRCNSRKNNRTVEEYRRILATLMGLDTVVFYGERLVVTALLCRK